MLATECQLRNAKSSQSYLSFSKIKEVQRETKGAWDTSILLLPYFKGWMIYEDFHLDVVYTRLL